MIDLHKDKAPLRISENFSFFVIYLEVFIDILLIYIDYFRLTYICVLSMSVIARKSLVMK